MVLKTASSLAPYVPVCAHVKYSIWGSGRSGRAVCPSVVRVFLGDGWTDRDEIRNIAPLGPGGGFIQAFFQNFDFFCFKFFFQNFDPPRNRRYPGESKFEKSHNGKNVPWVGFKYRDFFRFPKFRLFRFWIFVFQNFDPPHCSRYPSKSKFEKVTIRKMFLRWGF